MQSKGFSKSMRSSVGNGILTVDCCIAVSVHCNDYFKNECEGFIRFQPQQTFVFERLETCTSF